MFRDVIHRLKPVPLVLLAALQLPAQSADEIIRRSVERDQSNFERLADYTFLEETTETRYRKDGSVDSAERTTEEVLMLAGRPYYRVVARDGKPLAEKDARKEQEKLDKEAAKRQKESEKDRAKWAKEREEERRFFREIPDAYTFTLLGTEQVGGHTAWRIHAEPREEFEPKEDRAKILKKIRGDVWVSQAEYQWVKAEFDVIDTISWGWFVLRIPPGARIAFEQARVNDEVWVPLAIHIRADAKLGLLKTFRMGVDVAYRDYRKFQTESKIIGVE